MGNTIRSYGGAGRDVAESTQDAMDRFTYDPESQISPDYMQPIGDSGFFITPSEPADPWDCVRYPNSPYCGGTGIDIDSLDNLLPATLEPSISANDCETCLNIDGSLFWISLARGQVCYRSKDPSCYRDPPPPPPPPPDPTPPPGSTVGPIGFTPNPGGSGTPGCGCGGNIMVGTLIVNFLGFGGYSTGAIQNSNGPPYGFFSRSFSSVNSAGEITTGEQWIFASWGAQRPTYTDWQTKNSVTINARGDVLYSEENFYLGWRQFDPKCRCPSPSSRNNPPPYPPPPPRGCSGMCCCKSSKNEMAEILEQLKRLSKRLGVSDYPILTPRWLVSNQGSATVRHESLTQFNFWLMRQLDALIGEFPIRVEIEDSDPTAAGNQNKTVSLPNLAEAVAEIYGLAAKTSIDSDVHTSFLMRLASEVMAAKTAALLAQDYASANASYLGYQGNEVKRKVNFAFDPINLDSLETILKGSQQTIVGWQNEDKENVAAYLQKLMFSSGLLKTVFFRKGSDLERVLKEVSQFLPDPEAEDSARWQEFLQLINNPESLENKGTEVKPEIRNIDKTSQQGGS